MARSGTRSPITLTQSRWRHQPAIVNEPENSTFRRSNLGGRIRSRETLPSGGPTLGGGSRSRETLPSGGPTLGGGSDQLQAPVAAG